MSTYKPFSIGRTVNPQQEQAKRRTLSVQPLSLYDAAAYCILLHACELINIVTLHYPEHTFVQSSRLHLGLQ